MTTKVVNIRAEEYDVYVGRAGQGQDGFFGNPFPLKPGASDLERNLCIQKFKSYFLERISEDPEFKRRLMELKGKRLGCFCKPKECHGDVIAEWLDSQPTKEKVMNPQINSFFGEHRFLSNFWPCEIEWQGHKYASVEHAFQAAKASNEYGRQMVQNAPNPAEAKKIGGRIPRKANWEKQKVNVMSLLVRQKFQGGTHGKNELQRQLLLTGHAELIEGNTWGDTFWGVCGGTGENHLGKILMQVRKEIWATLTPEQKEEWESTVHPKEETMEEKNTWKDRRDWTTGPVYLMVTGHRPNKLGGYGRSVVQDEVRAFLKKRLEGAQGKYGDRLIAVSGMALGVDQWFTEEALSLKITVHAYVPFGGQEDRWPPVSKKNYDDMLQDVIAFGGEVLCCGERNEDGSNVRRLLLERNSKMVAVADIALAVWNGSFGGTADAMAKINQKGIPVCIYNPDKKHDTWCNL